MWTEHDTQIMSSIETELLTLIDTYQFVLEKPGLSKEEIDDLVKGIKFKYIQIDWLNDIKNKLDESNT